MLKGHRKNRTKAVARPKKGLSREKLLDSAFGIAREHAIELAREMDVLRKITFGLSNSHQREDGSTGSNTSEIGIALGILRRLIGDARFESIKAVLEVTIAHINAGEWEQADTLVLGLFDRAWQMSQEYQVAKDAFFRHVRGSEFKTLSYSDPMTSDRGAALAKIMQSDKQDLETLFRDPEERPRELVINLEGDFDTIRLVKM